VKEHGKGEWLFTRLRDHWRQHHGLQHWLTVLSLIAGGFFLGHYINDHNIWIDARYAVSQKVLNFLFQVRGPLYPKRTALVFIGDEEYWSDPQLQARAPIQREYLAKLVDALDAADVAVIALDFDLRSPAPDGRRPITGGKFLENKNYIEETNELAKHVGTVATHRPVVLATSIADKDDGYVENANAFEESIPTPGCAAHQPAVARGYVQLPYDVRQVPLPLDAENLVTHQMANVESFSTAIVRCIDPVAYARAVEQGSDDLPFASYISEPQFENPADRRRIRASELLDHLDKVRPLLSGRIVIVSGNWNSRAFGAGPKIDLHDSPVGTIPGAMIHANYVEAMLAERTFSAVPSWFMISIELLAVLFLAVVLVLGLSAWKEATAVIGVALFFLLANFLLQDLGLFFDFFVPLLIVLGHAAFEKINGWRDAANDKGVHSHAA
jgi:hypothetical protein